MLIERLRAHDIDIVLTTDHARLGPTITALAAMVDEMHRAGAQLSTCEEPPMPNTIANMLLAFARHGDFSSEADSIS